MRGKVLAGGALAATLILGAIGGSAAIASSPGSDDASRGNVEAPEREFENDDREGTELAEQTGISLAEAERAATQAQPGQVTKVEVEDEHGYTVYKVEVAGQNGVEHELEVDAGNGDILASETEDDDDHNDDRDDWEDDRNDYDDRDDDDRDDD